MFKPIFKKAWQITWHHPVLWLFGFFAAFLFSNEANTLIQNFQTISRLFSRLFTLQINQQQISLFTNLQIFFSNIALKNLLIFTSLTLILICLAVFSQVVLIKTGEKLKAKSLLPLLSQEKKLSFKDCLTVNWRHFWLVLLLNFINLLLAYFIFLLVSYPLVLIFLKSGQQLYLGLFFVLAFLIFLVLSIVISFLTRFAIFYIILFDSRLGQSLRQAIALFRRHWLKSLYFALIIFIISLLVGLLLLAVIATAAIPLIIVNNLFLQFKIWAGYWLIIIFGLLLFSLITFFFGSIFSTFQTMAWLLFFSEKLHPDTSRG